MDRCAPFRITHDTYSGLIGAYLASHAISDALPFLCTGIGCKAKITTQLGDHDRCENFTTRMGWAELNEYDLIQNDMEKVRRNILGQFQRMPIGIMPVLISPVVKTISMGVEPFIEQLRSTTGLPLLFIPNASTMSTLWEGYCEVMKTVCGMIQWRTDRTEPHSVNIWGYPFTRYEQDDLANIKELRSLLGSIGLMVQAIFFSGSPTAELLDADRAAFNIVLPHAYPLAAMIKKVSRRPTFCTEIPLGVQGTNTWLGTIATQTGVNNSVVNKFVHKEEARVTKKIRALKVSLHGRTAALFLERPWISALIHTLKEIGMRVTLAAHTDGYYIEKNKKNTIIDASTPEKVYAALQRLHADLVIAPTSILTMLDKKPGQAQMTFGFPSYDDHPSTTPLPTLGYNGMLSLMQRIANVVPEKKTKRTSR